MCDEDDQRSPTAGGVRYEPLTPVRAHAGYGDVEALPPHLNGEIVAGELWVSPRPAVPHARASSRALMDIGGAFDGGNPGGWHILHEPELHLDADVLVPDLAGWRVDRLPALPDAPALDIVPDWVCEVVSPSTARLDRVAKLPRYHLHGVEWAWMLDPLARTLEVFHRTDAGFALEQTFAGDGDIRARPFDAAVLALRRWWLDATPP